MYAIVNGQVNMDSRINYNLPTIPSEVHSVNFTWHSGPCRYYYHFDRLQSLDETILKPPTVSIKVKGKVPQVTRGMTDPSSVRRFWLHSDFGVVRRVQRGAAVRDQRLGHSDVQHRTADQYAGRQTVAGHADQVKFEKGMRAQRCV